MKWNNKYLLLLGLTTTFSASFVFAQSSEHIVVAPKCLVQQLGTIPTPIAIDGNLQLLSADQNIFEQLIAAKHQSKKPCGGFMDVSAAWENRNSTQMDAKAFLHSYQMHDSIAPVNYEIKYEKQVNSLIKKVKPEHIYAELTKLTEFPDRYAGSDTGVQAAKWIEKRVLSFAAKAGRTDITTRFVATGSRYQQPSLVVKMGNGDEPGVVIGGHMDTLSSSRWSGDKPGADDDGSGSMSLLETAHALISSKREFKKPIYFIWYAAEEMGLVGSQYVVTDFKQKNIPVSAVMQLDMTGWAGRGKADRTLWLLTDNVNTALTDYIAKLVTTYVKQPVDKTRCGYGCSDHASWTKGGFASAAPFESKFGAEDPYIHTSRDKKEELSPEHMADFSKLALAFAVELAEPVKKVY